MRLTGLGVSPGIGVGRALVLKGSARDLQFGIPAALVDRELARLEEARERSRGQIQQIKERIARSGGPSHHVPETTRPPLRSHRSGGRDSIEEASA